MGTRPANWLSPIVMWNGIYASEGGWLSRGSSWVPGRFHLPMSPDVIAITDLDLGNKSVTNDIENVLRKIEYWHQGPIKGYRIMYRDSERIWDGVHWDGNEATFLYLGETDEERARAKL